MYRSAWSTEEHEAIFPLKTAPFKPVSHDPNLRKRVIMEDRRLCITHMSHITLEPGNAASPHVHPSASEIFYCIRGGAILRVMGRAVTVESGGCVIIEAGEEHSIDKVLEETDRVPLFSRPGRVSLPENLVKFLKKYEKDGIIIG